MSEQHEGRPSLWATLRGARVPQVLGVYAGVSFAVIQGGDIFVERLGLPDWTFFGLVVVILAGVPVLVITALVQHSRRAEEGQRAEAELLARAAAGSGVGSDDDAPGRAPPSPKSPAPPSATTRRLRNVFTWRNSGLAAVGAVGFLAALVAGFMILRALGIGPPGSLVAAGVIDREEAILIADFQSRTGDELLGMTATEAFRIDFEQSPLVRVVGPGTVREGLLRMQLPADSPLTPELARELALREGIKAYLVGEISPAGRRSMLSVRLVSTASLPALRLYSQGARALDLERDYPAGIALLEEAIALDSTFAMAWRKLGVGLLNARYPRDRWIEAFTRAHEHSDRLTDRERYLTRAAYHTYVSEDQDRAMAAYRTVLDTYPGETTALNNLAGILAGRGDHAGAAELYRRALSLDSAAVIYYTNLMNQLGALGEWEEAEHVLHLYRSRFAELPGSRAFAATFRAARGDFQEARALLESVLDDPRAGLSARALAEGGLANLALIRGHLDEATRHAQANRELRRRMGWPVSREEAAAYPLRIRLLVVGDTAGALQGAEALIREMGLGPDAASEGTHLEVAEFFLGGGAADRARDFLRAWDEAPLDDRDRDGHREKRRTLALYLEHMEGRHERLGQLYEARGDPEVARRHYRHFVELWSEADPALQPRVQAARERLAALEGR